MDGFAPEFYKRFGEILAPQMLEVYHSCLKSARHLSSWTAAKIILIHMVGKDPSLPQSYQPISLLNIDYKILASILSVRLNSVIAKYIHLDQSGFLVGRYLRGNIRWVMKVIDHAQF